MLRHHLAGQEGPLACERIVEVLTQIAADQSRSIAPGWLRLLERWAISSALRMLRRVKSKLPGSHNRPEFQRHRYPGIPIEQLKERMSRFQRVLGDHTPLAVEPVTATIFRISPA
jgi:hypothetical protein